MARALDEVVGGWSISGLASWRTGLAFETVANAFPISFANNVPAIFNGDTSNLKVDTHHEINAASGNPRYNYFKTQSAALGASPGRWDYKPVVATTSEVHTTPTSIGLPDASRLPSRCTWSFAQMHITCSTTPTLNYRSASGTTQSGVADISSPSTFGVITHDYGARVLQLALRLDF